MTDQQQQHPIVPPPELVQEWCLLPLSEEELLVIAAQWGADQEFEASVECLESHNWHTAAQIMRSARRPNPPSLKEQVLADFNWLINRTLGHPEVDERSKRILQALESLSND